MIQVEPCIPKESVLMKQRKADIFLSLIIVQFRLIRLFYCFIIPTVTSPTETPDFLSLPLFSLFPSSPVCFPVCVCVFVAGMVFSHLAPGSGPHLSQIISSPFSFENLGSSSTHHQIVPAVSAVATLGCSVLCILGLFFLYFPSC